MPALSMSSGFSSRARTRSVRLAWSRRLSIAWIAPSSWLPGWAIAKAVTGWPTVILLAKRSGTQKSTRISERSSTTAIGVVVVT
ncbi:hypothetical protein D9M70_526710 [compost metagenome]